MARKLDEEFITQKKKGTPSESVIVCAQTSIRRKLFRALIFGHVILALAILALVLSLNIDTTIPTLLEFGVEEPTKVLLSVGTGHFGAMGVITGEMVKLSKLTAGALFIVVLVSAGYRLTSDGLASSLNILMMGTIPVVMVYAASSFIAIDDYDSSNDAKTVSLTPDIQSGDTASYITRLSQHNEQAGLLLHNVMDQGATDAAVVTKLIDSTKETGSSGTSEQQALSYVTGLVEALVIKAEKEEPIKDSEYLKASRIAVLSSLLMAGDSSLLANDKKRAYRLYELAQKSDAGVINNVKEEIDNKIIENIENKVLMKNASFVLAAIYMLFMLVAYSAWRNITRLGRADTDLKMMNYSY